MDSPWSQDQVSLLPKEMNLAWSGEKVSDYHMTTLRHWLDNLYEAALLGFVYTYERSMYEGLLLFG